jgi:hypothetical protein
MRLEIVTPSDKAEALIAILDALVLARTIDAFTVNIATTDRQIAELQGANEKLQRELEGYRSYSSTIDRLTRELAERNAEIAAMAGRLLELKRVLERPLLQPSAASTATGTMATVTLDDPEVRV